MASPLASTFVQHRPKTTEGDNAQSMKESMVSRKKSPNDVEVRRERITPRQVGSTQGNTSHTIDTNSITFHTMWVCMFSLNGMCGLIRTIATGQLDYVL